MVEEAPASRSRRMIETRARRFRTGGVGVMMEPPEPPRRRLRDAVPISVAAKIVLLAGMLLCTGAGFAGASMWNGQNSGLMDQDYAFDRASDPTLRSDKRNAAMTQVAGFGRNAIDQLLELADDDEVGATAKAYLRILAHRSKTALQTAGN